MTSTTIGADTWYFDENAFTVPDREPNEPLYFNSKDYPLSEIPLPGEDGYAFNITINGEIPERTDPSIEDAFMLMLSGGNWDLVSYRDISNTNVQILEGMSLEPETEITVTPTKTIPEIIEAIKADKMVCARVGFPIRDADLYEYELMALVDYVYNDEGGALLYSSPFIDGSDLIGFSLHHVTDDGHEEASFGFSELSGGGDSGVLIAEYEINNKVDIFNQTLDGVYDDKGVYGWDKHTINYDNLNLNGSTLYFVINNGDPIEMTDEGDGEYRAQRSGGVYYKCYFSDIESDTYSLAMESDDSNLIDAQIRIYYEIVSGDIPLNPHTALSDILNAISDGKVVFAKLFDGDDVLYIPMTVRGEVDAVGFMTAIYGESYFIVHVRDESNEAAWYEVKKIDRNPLVVEYDVSVDTSGQDPVCTATTDTKYQEIADAMQGGRPVSAVLLDGVFATLPNAFYDNGMGVIVFSLVNSAATIQVIHGVDESIAVQHIPATP